jgi:hypothetical protein
MAEIVRLRKEHAAMRAKLEKVAAYCDRLAERAEANAKDSRFISLAKANEADAKNWRATAMDIRTAIPGEA